LIVVFVFVIVVIVAVVRTSHHTAVKLLQLPCCSRAAGVVGSLGDAVDACVLQRRVDVFR
jgi:hypothetical protein